MYEKLTEEALKSQIVEDFFKDSFKYTQIDRIDFVIARKQKNDADILESFLWAEAKQGTKHDIYESFVQLILTIGKQNLSKNIYLPPKYLGAFDAEKFAFIEYHKVMHIFSQNDFNWKVTPSDHTSKEFKQLLELCKRTLEENSLIFYYENYSEELRKFIKQNFSGKHSSKISVDKNNFVRVFQKWNDKVKNTIDVPGGWEKFSKEEHILPRDFFLADLISEDNNSLKKNLTVVLQTTKYRLNNGKSDFWNIGEVFFNDKQKAHRDFWAIYERPPKEDYQNYILERSDLLVPSDIREIEGTFFTPKIWVDKSQKYIADVFGEDWQDEYYVWDNCAGTGNLLNGLTNNRNIFASTLIQSDVNAMKDIIGKGLNLFEDHIFQFDFLNDDFIPKSKGGKMPDALYDIINDPQKRKKLIIYINPPYAEAATAKTTKGTGKNKTGVSITNKTYEKYKSEIGISARELYAHFFIRIYKEIPDCILGSFSTIKILLAPTFERFRSVFKAKLLKIFAVPSDSFDNVPGKFPIGFFIWDTSKKEVFSEIYADIFNKKGSFLMQRKFAAISDFRSINDWIIETRNRPNEEMIGYMYANGADFQHNKNNCIKGDKSLFPDPRGTMVTTKNISEIAIYLAVRQSVNVKATWIDNKDLFLYPNDGWKDDKEFHSDCLAFTLFHGQNKISAEESINHWIPFSEQEVGCKKEFKSHFMHDFINGRIEIKTERTIFEEETTKKSEKLKFSEEAQAVFDAGKELWKYYHSQPNTNPDASFYDIRKYFQGETDGTINKTSENETYNVLIQDLRSKMKVLTAKIIEKVYEYGFLK